MDDLKALVARWRNEANRLRELGLSMADPTVMCREARDIDNRADELEAAIARPAGGECPDDATNLEVIEWFLRACREMKPVGQWPGERVCTAIERTINAPRRFIAEADMPPERGHNGRGGDGPQSLPPFRRAAAPTPPSGEDARDAERYRWLVENAIIETDKWRIDCRDSSSTKHPTDAAIDSAIAASKEE